MVVGGAALAREVGGRVVFVTGALAGETVVVQMRSSKKDFATADVVDVVVASKDRVVPPCEAWHRGCGGCDWQHIEPSAQLALKVGIVREALERTGRLDSPVVVGGGSVQPWGYRTTVRVGAVPDGRVGFRSRRSHDLVIIDNCLVAHPLVNSMLATVRSDGLDELTIRVAVSGDARSAAVGSAITEMVAGHTFRVSAESFFQSSPQAAELLVQAVARAADGIALTTSTVIDAYGGVGLFAATVAAGAQRIVLVEASPSACADARVNLAGLPADVVEAKVEDWAPIRAQLVIADPARNGLDKAAAAVLAATHAARIVLVSCDAGSLARDARLLVALGYVHRGTEVIDVFPNTSHVEAVTRFDRDSTQIDGHER